MVFETALSLIVIFTILVAFHEFGHLLVAKACGMRVEEFAIGFGPLLKKLGKRGATEYNVRAIPLGGFVRIAGQEAGQEDIPDGFQAQKAWKRALVVFAGPFASAVLAVLTFVLLGIIWGFPTGTTTNRVINVFPQSEAARIGIRTGDRVIAVDGQRVHQGFDLTGLIRQKAGQKVNLQIDRRGEVHHFSGVPEYNIQAGGIAWSFNDGKPATANWMASESKKIGILEKDELVSINGQKILSGSQMQSVLQQAGKDPLNITIRRSGETKSFTVNPYVTWVQYAGVKWGFPGAGALPDDFDKSAAGNVKVGDELISINGVKVKDGDQMLKLLASSEDSNRLKIDRDGRTYTIEVPANEKITSSNYLSIGLFGFALEPYLKREGFTTSISKGVQLTTSAAVAIVSTITSPKVKEDIGGPVMIGKITQSAVKLGPYWVIATLGSLSISLAVINLVPIPLLDGGVLAVLAIESIRRRRLSIREQNAVALVGLMIIGLLIVSVLYMDVTKLVKGLVPQ